MSTPTLEIGGFKLSNLTPINTSLGDVPDNEISEVKRYPFMYDFFYNTCNGEVETFRLKWIANASAGNVDFFQRAVDELAHDSIFTWSNLNRIRCTDIMSPESPIADYDPLELSLSSPSPSVAVPVSVESSHSAPTSLISAIHAALHRRPDSPADSALFCAVSIGHVEIVELLLQLPWVSLDVTEHSNHHSALMHAVTHITGYNRRTATVRDSQLLRQPHLYCRQRYKTRVEGPDSNSNQATPTAVIKLPSHDTLTLAEQRYADGDEFEENGVVYRVHSKPPNLNRPAFETRPDRPKHGASITNTPHYPRTLLTDVLDVVTVLVAHGAKLTTRDHNGKTVLDLLPTNSLYRFARWAVRLGLTRLRRRVFEVRDVLEEVLMGRLGYSRAAPTHSNSDGVVGGRVVYNSDNTMTFMSSSTPSTPRKTTTATATTTPTTTARSSPIPTPTTPTATTPTPTAVGKRMSDFNPNDEHVYVLDKEGVVGVRDVTRDPLFQSIMSFLKKRYDSENHFRIGQTRPNQKFFVDPTNGPKTMGPLRARVAREIRDKYARRAKRQLMSVRVDPLATPSNGSIALSPLLTSPAPVTDTPTAKKAKDVLSGGLLSPKDEHDYLFGKPSGKKKDKKPREKPVKKTPTACELPVDTPIANMTMSTSQSSRPTTTGGNSTNGLPPLHPSRPTCTRVIPKDDNNNDEPMPTVHMDNEFDEDRADTMDENTHHAMEMVACVTSIVASYFGQDKYTGSSKIPSKITLPPLFSVD